MLPTRKVGRKYNHDFGMQNKELTEMCFDKIVKIKLLAQISPEGEL
jgi:hypothetical protein